MDRKSARILLLVISLSAACTALPEVGSFADATIELNAALKTGGATAVAELKAIDADKQAKDLAAAWTVRDKTGVALVAYGESLRAIVDAGNQGKESAGKLIDSVTGLATAAGITIPGSSAALAVAGDTARFIYGQISLMRSAKSLEAALDAAEPAVTRIAEVLAKDLRQAGEIFDLAMTELEDSIQTEEEMQVRLGYRMALTDERGALYALDLSTISDLRKRIHELMKQDAATLTAEEKKELAKIREEEANLTAAEARLIEIQALIKATDQWHDPLEARLAEIRKRQRVGIAFFAAAVATTTRWAAAHDRLIQAVKERRPYSAQSLMEAAVQVRELTGRMREL